MTPSSNSARPGLGTGAGQESTGQTDDDNRTADLRQLDTTDAVALAILHRLLVCSDDRSTEGELTDPTRLATAVVGTFGARFARRLSSELTAAAGDLDFLRGGEL